MAALAAGFFAGGGQRLQINGFDRETLLDAQARRDRCPDLLVRVAGLSALFVTLSRPDPEALGARAAPRGPVPTSG